VIYELNHVGVRIRDLEASLAFYTGVLGAKVVDEAYIPGSRTDCVHIQVADGLVELLRPADPPPGTSFGLDHVGFMTDDLDGEHERLAAAGFAFSVPPKVAGSGRGRLAFLADPAGVRVELLQREEEFRVPVFTSGLARSLDHVSVAADDLDTSAAFYAKQLGMRGLATLTDSERAATLAYFHIGADAIELVHPEAPTPEAPRIGHLGVRVDDVAAAVETVRSAGVPVAPDHPRAAGTGHGQVAACRDPDGVTVLLLDRDDLRGTEEATS
jgi:catechol 2,3-dioxygenase-like lactoylglutathione lyase family enzyme